MSHVTLFKMYCYSFVKTLSQLLFGNILKQNINLLKIINHKEISFFMIITLHLLYDERIYFKLALSIKHLCSLHWSSQRKDRLFKYEYLSSIICRPTYWIESKRLLVIYIIGQTCKPYVYVSRYVIDYLIIIIYLPDSVK